MKILLPDTVPLFLKRTDGVEVVAYDPTTPVPEEHIDADALVVWGNSPAMLRDAACRLHQLKWVQTLAAGPDTVLSAEFDPSVVITSGRSLHDLPVAEHALALSLAAARSLPELFRAQIGHRWAAELGGMQPIQTPDRLTTLRGARTLIWGFGGIARTLAPWLRALGADVMGVAQSERTVDGYRVASVDSIDEFLPAIDLLIMILPATPSTNQVLSADRIALLQRHAWLVNVGRGSTVDEEALVRALQNRQLGGAALDVTAHEPLPPSSELWGLPNVIITPHSAGGRPLGGSELVAENLSSLLSGAPLRNVVTRQPVD